MTPQAIAHYRITAKLGEGGMGEVYRATDTKLGREVAIKILPEAFAHDAERMARFEREAQVLAALNHPNIAAIYGVEERALVMELVEGETLAGLLPVDMALNYARQIAEALEAAHEKGIIHRDLKPANVKVTPDGMVKVLDFGLAKLSEDPQAERGTSVSPTLTISPTRAGMILGTAAYMAPEQARGGTVDKRADIWAFGAVLYEMLSGRPAFTGETTSDILAGVLRAEPDWSALPAATPARIRRLLRRCLERDRKQRLRDIGEARIAIGAPEEDQVIAQPAPPRSHWIGWAAGGVLAICAIALTASWWRAARPVERPLISVSVDLGLDAIAGADYTAALSPDGMRIAFPARTAEGSQALAVRSLSQSKATILPGTENGFNPFFSPDSQWIGYFTLGKLKKISVQGGAAVTLCDAPGRGSGSWGENGYIIAALAPVVGLSRIPEGGGPPEPLTKPGEKAEVTHRWPQILPGGRAVLFTTNTVTANFDEANIDVLSIKTGRRKTVQRGGYFGRYLPSGHLVYVHHGTLFGVPFDLTTLEVKGTSAPLVEDLSANVRSGGGGFDISQNGTLVYLSGRTSPSVWPVLWLDRLGKTQAIIPTPGFYLHPRVSPDGSRIAVETGSGKLDIWVYDLQRELSTKLTFAGPRNSVPVWAPDGKHIAYLSQLEDRFVLMWIRSDGVGEPQRLWESRNVMAPYSFSPDGRRLAFWETSLETNSDIWTLPLELSDPDHPKAGRPEAFLRTPAREAYPAISPDGRWMAYVSHESGRPEIYVIPFAGGSSSVPSGSSGRWQISAGGVYPTWSRTARQLLYETPDNQIMVADYTVEGDSFRLGQRRLWADKQLQPLQGVSPGYDLAPDGKRLAVLPAADEPHAPKGNLHVTMLMNWFDEVRRRVPLVDK